MNWDILLAILFYIFLVLFYFHNKKKFTVQNKIFFLYKTTWGLRWMDSFSKKFPRILRIFAFCGVLVAYAGMAFILYTLITQTYYFLTVEGATPPLAPVLPGVQIPGAPHLSFVHWIMVIFIVAAVHEFFHGVVARLHSIKIKSSGFAFLGPILAAFVEPDEKSLQKKKYEQLSVYAAGPFVNIVFALFIILIAQFIFLPVFQSTVFIEGVTIGKVLEGYPMEQTHIKTPFTISQIGNIPVSSVENFFQVISSFKPNQTVQLITDKGSFSVTPAANPENASRGFLGITEFTFPYKLKPAYRFLPEQAYLSFMDWINLFLIWLFVISLGVGLFNLLPLGPVDGGRIFYFTLLHVTHDKKKTMKIFNFVSLFVLLLILVNLSPYLLKFFYFLLKPVALLLGA